MPMKLIAMELLSGIQFIVKTIRGIMNYVSVNLVTLDLIFNVVVNVIFKLLRCGTQNKHLNHLTLRRNA